MRFPIAVSLRLFAVSLAFAAPQAATQAEQQQKENGGANSDRPFLFKDVSKQAGIIPPAAGIRGHGAGWGDVDGDGWVDLYVGTFHTDGSQANLLLRNVKGAFQLDDQQSLRISTRATGVVFADFDNDGDPDLYVGSMPAPEGSQLATREGHPLAGCSLFRNEGGGKYTDISQGSGACPPAFGGRSATVLDYDGDARLDLLVGEDPLPGYNGSKTASSRLFRNLGELRFEDVSREVGLPADIPGLGVAAADVNQDGWPDFFLASSGERGNRLFLNDGKGKVVEATGAREVFAWPDARGDDMVCGVAIGDVNRDGLPDIVLGQHFQRPWLEPRANRLYLNRGVTDGVPKFADITEAAGLVPLQMKAPHVEIQDFDNDGWPDIYTSIVKFADGQPHPVIFRNLGAGEESPRFAASGLDVNDFPDAADKAVKKTRDFFDKLNADRKITYTAPGPSADYDNDGRLDLFLCSWWMENSSMLLRNETAGGNWLDVRAEGTNSVNRMGIGSRVNLYEPGKLGTAESLLGSREIAAGFGYASGQEPIAHFGVGNRDAVDVEVVFPHGRGRSVKSGVRTNQRISIPLQ